MISSGKAKGKTTDERKNRRARDTSRNYSGCREDRRGGGNYTGESKTPRRPRPWKNLDKKRERSSENGGRPHAA